MFIHYFFLSSDQYLELERRTELYKRTVSVAFIAFSRRTDLFTKLKGFFSNNFRSSMGHLYSLSLSRNKIKLTYFLCIMHDFRKWGKTIWRLNILKQTGIFFFHFRLSLTSPKEGFYHKLFTVKTKLSILHLQDLGDRYLLSSRPKTEPIVMFHGVFRILWSRI